MYALLLSHPINRAFGGAGCAVVFGVKNAEVTVFFDDRIARDLVAESGADFAGHVKERLRGVGRNGRDAHHLFQIGGGYHADDAVGGVGLEVNGAEISQHAV